jgi:hypothetical protein
MIGQPHSYEERATTSTPFKLAIIPLSLASTIVSTSGMRLPVNRALKMKSISGKEDISMQGSRVHNLHIKTAQQNMIGRD